MGSGFWDEIGEVLFLGDNFLDEIEGMVNRYGTSSDNYLVKGLT